MFCIINMPKAKKPKLSPEERRQISLANLQKARAARAANAAARAEEKALVAAAKAAAKAEKKRLAEEKKKEKEELSMFRDASRMLKPKKRKMTAGERAWAYKAAGEKRRGKILQGCSKNTEPPVRWEGEEPDCVPPRVLMDKKGVAGVKCCYMPRKQRAAAVARVPRRERVPKEKKPRAPPTEAQLENLAKGRAKRAENLRRKKEGLPPLPRTTPRRSRKSEWEPVDYESERRMQELISPTFGSRGRTQEVTPTPRSRGRTSTFESGSSVFFTPSSQSRSGSAGGGMEEYESEEYF